MAHIDCVGKGWHPIVQPLIDYCNKHGIEILQVKEKFGGLRFYTGESPYELDLMISDAEAHSEITCEVCGEPGSIQGRGWLKCVCPRHTGYLVN